MKVCNNCNSKTTLHCQCKKAYYCGKECQIRDWKNHKKVCLKALERLNPGNIDIKFLMDYDSWRIFRTGSDNTGFTEEYTPKEDFELKEIVTFQAYFNKKRTAKYFYLSLMWMVHWGLETTPEDDVVQSNIIFEDENCVFGEWWFSDGDICLHNLVSARHEWYKVFKVANHLFTIRYTTQKIGEIEKVRKMWEERFHKAYLQRKD